MTQPVPPNFADLLIYLGNDADPIVYTQLPIAMSSKSFDQSVSTTKRTTPDTADEDALVTEQSAPSTLSYSVTGKGKVDKASYTTFLTALGAISNFKINIAGVGMWVGPMILTKFTLSGERTNTFDVDVSLEQSDVLAFTAADGTKLDGRAAARKLAAVLHPSQD